MRTLAALCALGLLGCAKQKRDASAERVEVVSPVPAAVASQEPYRRAPDPRVLGELLLAVPSAAPVPTKPGGTLIGAETSARAAVSVAPAATAPPPAPADKPRVQAPLSSAAIERAAREQIYWQLQRCRLPGGRQPPPEVVSLQFLIRSDGTVLPGSVRTSATDKQYESVADCVERVFAASSFRGPPEGKGAASEVTITWPSVD